MRQIGHLPGGQARVFSDFLVARGIRNEVERENNGSYSVWVHDEDQVTDAQEFLTHFSRDPNAADFVEAGAQAEKVRAAQKADLEAYRRRVRTGKSVFPKVGGYGVGVLTYALIVICVIVFVYTRFGADREAMLPFFIADPRFDKGQLSEVFAGQVWRLFSPIVIHMNAVHIIFNMMWLYQLGCMIEGRRSTLNLLGVIALTALVSNVAQYYIGGISAFGGMSGVVYGLAGYVWIRGKLDPASGLFLDTQSLIILLVWQVLCYTGWVGPIANTAHVAGLVVGLMWGGLSAVLARGKNPQ